MKEPLLKEQLPIQIIFMNGVSKHLIGIPFITDARIGMNVNPRRRGKPAKLTPENSNSALPCIDLGLAYTIFCARVGNTNILLHKYLQERDLFPGDCEWLVLKEFDIDYVLPSTPCDWNGNPIVGVEYKQYSFGFKEYNS